MHGLCGAFIAHCTCNIIGPLVQIVLLSSSTAWYTVCAAQALSNHTDESIVESTFCVL